MATNYASTPAMDWSGEITAPAQNDERQAVPRSSGMPQMNHHLPDAVVETPTTVNEAYMGSLKAMLQSNRGNYIVATFLIGTQSTVSWEGVLYEVGNDYLTIYQVGRDRYVVCDIYSLKYMEFYDTRRRQMCDQILNQRNMGGLANGAQGW